ncbi:hypothetical protein Avbf_04103 [Armadillidium vulgare]|nr:hypothetical protein Avbf_04103 [Armadillidium vulgare]
MNSNKNSAPFPLPEKNKSKFPSASPLTTLLLRRSSSSQKEKLNKSGGEPDYEEIGPQMNNKGAQNGKSKIS